MKAGLVADLRDMGLKWTPAGRDRQLASLKAKRRRRMGAKFIPDGDSDFALMARNFAGKLAKEPSRYQMSEEDVREICEAVDAYRAALAANTHRFTKSLQTVYRKDEARKRAERLIREAGSIIRASRKVDALDKKLIGASARPERLRKRGVPETAPRLSFVGGVPFSNTIDGTHVIEFRDPVSETSKAKPPGATRLELYVDLVPVNEPIPTWPGQRWGGRTWYLRSYTRGPMKVKYPKCNEPMRVVYWACWANATGERGPWSPTLATRVDGIDQALPAAPKLAQLNSPREQTIIITSGHKQLPDLVDVNTIDESRMLTDEREAAA